jgi:hypothetical protein
MGVVRTKESAVYFGLDAQPETGGRDSLGAIMQATDLSTFHRWLLTDAVTGSPSIVVHGYTRLPAGLTAAVARHLNEFDEDARGNWISFAPELIDQIAASPTQRCLLGLNGRCECAASREECSHLRETLESLAKRGHAVLEGAIAMEASQASRNVFRVWLGWPPDQGETLHLILHPEHFDHRSLPAIIGDTFVEWASARLTQRAR